MGSKFETYRERLHIDQCIRILETWDTKAILGTYTTQSDIKVTGYAQD